jgi:hypothetical protein
MLDYNDPMQRPAIDVLVSILKGKVDTYNMHHAARQSKSTKAVDPGLNRLAALPKSSDGDTLLSYLDENLSTISQDIIAGIPSGEEHLYANVALKFQAMADHFKGIAKTWAPDFAQIQAPVSSLPEGTEPMSLEDLQKLAKDCDDAFRLVLTSVNQIKERLNDADALADVEKITGQTTVVRRSSKNDSVQYLLDIPRIRKAKDDSTSSESANGRMSLRVNGVDMGEENFSRDCQMAFSMNGPQFLDAVRSANDGSLPKFNREFIFDHDGTDWNVVIVHDSNIPND